MIRYWFETTCWSPRRMTSKRVAFRRETPEIFQPLEDDPVLKICQRGPCFPLPLVDPPEYTAKRR